MNRTFTFSLPTMTQGCQRCLDSMRLMVQATGKFLECVLVSACVLFSSNREANAAATVWGMRRLAASIPVFWKWPLVLIALLVTGTNVSAQDPYPGLQQQIPPAEYAALVDFYNSTGGPGWNNSVGWNDPNAEWWEGIGVDEFEYDNNGEIVPHSGHVLVIQLLSNNLRGEIPASFQAFTHLFLLRLPGNRLTNSIPSSIGNNRELDYFELDHNGFTGEIPATFGNLAKVKWMRLNNNQLTGSIPDELGNCRALTWVLDLSGNRLSGNIPVTLGNLTDLQNLFLGRNSLSGPIPATLGNLTKLLSLELSLTGVSGPIPDSFGNLRELRQLILGSNQLSNSIPDIWANLTNLQFLSLAVNRLSGNLPNSLGSLSQLQSLYAGGNELSGSIPDSLANLGQVQYFDLSNNQLVGGISNWFGRLTNLFSLRLNDNQLAGNIPDSLGNLYQLQRLNLSGNNLSGSIPISLGSLTNLQDMFLYVNQLKGPIPDSFGGLRKLQYFEVNSNQLSGTIPMSLTNMVMLNTARIDRNCFIVSPGTTNRALINLWIQAGTQVYFEPQNECYCLALTNDKVPEHFKGWFGSVVITECNGHSIVDYDVPVFLQGGPGDTNNGLFSFFFLNSLSNRVEFDYETGPTNYSIRIATSHYGGLSGSVIIHVTDVDEGAPPANPPPVIQNITPNPGGGVGYSVAGVPGTIYDLEVSTNLLFWEPWRTVTVPSLGITNIVDSSSPAGSQKFYRATPQ